MSRHALFNKVKAGPNNEYSMICTTQKAGCMLRHGPALKSYQQPLIFAPCDVCRGFPSPNSVKYNPTWYDGQKPYEGTK